MSEPVQALGAAEVAVGKRERYLVAVVERALGAIDLVYLGNSARSQQRGSHLVHGLAGARTGRVVGRSVHKRSIKRLLNKNKRVLKRIRIGGKLDGSIPGLLNGLLVRWCAVIERGFDRLR